MHWTKSDDVVRCNGNNFFSNFYSIVLNVLLMRSKLSANTCHSLLKETFEERIRWWFVFSARKDMRARGYSYYAPLLLYREQRTGIPADQLAHLWTI